MSIPPDSSAAGSWLLGLLLLWAALLLGGFVFGPTADASGQRIPTWARMASSFTLVVAAWSWYLCARPSGVGTFSLLIALGMTLGFIGDLFMAGLLPVGQPVLAGMASFGCGHLAYLAGFACLANRTGLSAPLPLGAAWLAWVLVGLAGWAWIVFPSPQPAGLRGAALGYVLLLASTAGVATGLALQAPNFWPLAGGAALFFVSDLILAAQLFAGLQFPLMGSAVWLTYGPGQMLIVYSTWSALGRAG
jgi:hypothetical protein